MSSTVKRPLSAKGHPGSSASGTAPLAQAKKAKPMSKSAGASAGGGDDLDDGFGLSALRGGGAEHDFDASDDESHAVGSRAAPSPAPSSAAAVAAVAAAPSADSVPFAKKRGGRNRNADGTSEAYAGSAAAAVAHGAADGDSSLLTGKKRGRGEIEAAAAAGGAAGRTATSSSGGKAPAAGGAGKGTSSDAAAGGAGAAASGDDSAAPALYRRVATDLLSQKPAAAQAAGVWAAFSKSKTGAKLSDEEIAAPLAEGHIAAAGAGAKAVTGTLLDMGDLPAVVRAVLPEWKRVFGWKAGAKKRDPGAPALIIVTYSAVRAAAMLKPLSVFSTRIGKLFGKHLSIEDQRAILKGPPITIAIGTPHRLAALIDEGALSLSASSVVLVDVHPDVKGFTLLDHPNLKEDVFALLRDHLHGRIAAGSLKLALY